MDRSGLDHIDNLGSIQEVRVKVLLVDGKNLSYRCFVAGDFTTKEGEHVEVPFLFIKILSKIIRDVGNVDRVIVCWDGGRSTVRKHFYPAYKEHGEVPNSLTAISNQVVLQYAKLKEILTALGVYTLQYPNVEADDLLAYLTKFSLEDSYVIVSSDKDYLHLVSEKVEVSDGRGKWSKLIYFRETNRGLTPQGYLYAHALLGDGSDNIEGIPGIGWGTIEDIAPLLNDLTTASALGRVLQAEFPKPSKRIQTIIDNLLIFKRNLFLIDLKSPERHIYKHTVLDMENVLASDIRFNDNKVLEFLKQHEMQSLVTRFQYWFAPYMHLK